MSLQGKLARAPIYKSLSLFMIKSLQTKLGRGPLWARHPMPCSRGWHRHQACSLPHSASRHLMSRDVLMCSFEYCLSRLLQIYKWVGANLETWGLQIRPQLQISIMALMEVCGKKESWQRLWKVVYTIHNVHPPSGCDTGGCGVASAHWEIAWPSGEQSAHWESERVQDISGGGNAAKHSAAA